jgi:hypothetical protein
MLFNMRGQGYFPFVPGLSVRKEYLSKMHNPRTRKGQEPGQVAGAESFDAWFAREMSGLNLDLARLEAETPPAPVVEAEAKGLRRAELQDEAAEAPAAKGLHAAREAAPAPPPPTELWPTGTDLADPKNFGVRPPVKDLEQGAVADDDYRQRLSRHIAFATTVLHTSRVPAAVWREWRGFERAAQERLRELAAGPAVTAGAKD